MNGPDYPQIRKLRLNATGFKIPLTKLKINKASAPYDLLAYNLIELADQIAPYTNSNNIHTIFTIMQDSSLPQDWLKAKVTPISRNCFRTITIPAIY